MSIKSKLLSHAATVMAINDADGLYNELKYKQVLAHEIPGDRDNGMPYFDIKYPDGNIIPYGGTLSNK